MAFRYLLSGSALLLGSCVAPLAQSPLPDLIVAERGGFVPEGIEYDNLNGRILTGSLSDGTVYEISSAGRLIPVTADAGLQASVGIEVDEPRNRLLVAVSQQGGASSAANLGIYDLDSGARLAMVDLTSAISDPPSDMENFANDVAVSRAGIIFVTDTSMNIVYRVDRYQRASVLLDLGADSGYALNGIEYHPEGYLLVAAMGTAQLLRIPVDNPQRWSLVELDYPMSGADGLVWAADGGLVATSNSISAVLKYHSDDHWASARLTGMASFAGQGTTAATVGADIYVVLPHFADDDAPEIVRAEF